MDKILEFCGFKKKPFEDNSDRFFWVSPCGYEGCGTPPLDMNFFFKYVEPKLAEYKLEKWDTYHEATLVISKSKQGYGYADTANKAWQEALLKLIGGKNENTQ